MLEQAPLFRGVSRPQSREIALRARACPFRRKERIVEQGELLEKVLLLGWGRVKITVLGPDGQEVTLRLLGPGQVMAGLYQTAGVCSPVGVVALEAGHTLAWDQRVLDELFDRTPILHRNALRIVSERLRSMEERFQELCTDRVPVRLARTLLRLLGQIGRPAEGGIVISLSREELAQMIGTTLFTVSRLLSLWEAAGMLRAGRESVFVADASALTSLTQPTDASRP